MSETKEFREIPLTQGKIAIVDASDYEWLSQWKWYAQKDKRGHWYALRGVRAGSKTRQLRMHRCILNAPKNIEVDHRDGDGLNNRRSNLRPATHQQNLCNRGPNSTNTSGFKGVYWAKECNRWRAWIGVNSKGISLGYFTDKVAAAKAYEEAARRLHGQFARTTSQKGTAA